MCKYACTKKRKNILLKILRWSIIEPYNAIKYENGFSVRYIKYEIGTSQVYCSLPQRSVTSFTICCSSDSSFNSNFSFLLTLSLGAFIGTMVTNLVAGFLASSYGWPSIFYVTGLCGLLYAALWLLLSAHSPATHPNISPHEKMYILASLNTVESTGDIVIFSFNYSRLLINWERLNWVRLNFDISVIFLPVIIFVSWYGWIHGASSTSPTRQASRIGL